MGLDFTWEGRKYPEEETPHWSYSGFHTFRENLAAEIGIDLNIMYGFGGMATWNPFRNDPIVLLLDHSDCDGELLPEQCARIAPRLRELTVDWPEDLTTKYGYDLSQARILADNMERCAELGVPLIFC